jgi:hypothetical protein
LKYHPLHLPSEPLSVILGSTNNARVCGHARMRLAGDCMIIKSLLLSLFFFSLVSMLLPILAGFNVGRC